MGRKLVIHLDGGGSRVLEQVAADAELQLQEQLKAHPELLPLEEVGLVAPAVVVGRETRLASGAIDLVLLGNGGDLALVEFKTGPQNPDFRHCLAQLLDYGSELWGMTLEEFEARVAQRYFRSSHCPPGSVAAGATLEDVLAARWGTGLDDAGVGWREHLQAQLRDGGFHYIAVAQRFTPTMERTLTYLNETTNASRFSAVELVRFTGGAHTAYEARFVLGAMPRGRGSSGPTKAALAGIDELLAGVIDDDYRHALQDLLQGLAAVAGLTVFLGTTGCSLRVRAPGRPEPLSVAWAFPPGPPSWMGLTDVTLGWYEDAKGLQLSQSARLALESYGKRVAGIADGSPVKSSTIHGRTFAPEVVVAQAAELEDAVREVATALGEA